MQPPNPPLSQQFGVPEDVSPAKNLVFIWLKNVPNLGLFM